MKMYLWKVEYDVVKAMRFTREKYIVTADNLPSEAEKIFMQDPDEGFDCIYKIEFEREVVSDE